MKQSIKKLMAILLAMTLMISLIGCESNQSNDSKKVVYVTAGALGDNGFSDSTARGLDKIKKDFGAETRIIENNNDSALFSQSLEAAFAWNPDVVFADAYGFEELYAQYADKHPDVDIINLDFIIDNKNITNVTYINEEGAYLAGVLAAKISQSNLDKVKNKNKVGFIGGDNIPVIRSFYYGFEQGVKSVDPNIEIVQNYVGDFFDAVKGKQVANQVYSQGVDIVFQAAGASGSGVLESAKENEKYVIGVDSNQNGIYPGYVVSSVVKDLENSVYEIYKSIDKGEFKKGEHIEKGAGIGGVYLVIDDFSKDILDENIINYIEDISKKVENKEIKVERYKD